MTRFSFSSLADRLDALLTPPFRGATIAVWVCFVLFSLVNRTDAIWQGNLSNPDDYLYLVQALDWLNGQSWFDQIQHRMNPPQGTFIHYSHLLSGFYAGIIALLRPFWGDSAALITAAVMPPVYLAAFLFAMRWLGRTMIAPGWGDMTAYILLFSPVIMSQFLPGHIAHHGLLALLTVTAFCCMTRMMERPAAWGWAAAAGIVMALGLALGLAIVAVVGIFALCLGLWAVIEGGAAARSGLVFGLNFLAGNIGFLFITRPLPHIFDAELMAYSIVYVILAGLFALCFACVALVERAPLVARVIMGGGVACAAGAIFLHYFPALKAGPYGGIDPSLAKLIFSSEPEAWPIFRAGAPLANQVLPLLWPAMAIAANLFVLAHASSHAQRWLWRVVLGVLSACLALAVFYQCRFLDYVQPFAALPLAAMIRHDWERRPEANAAHVVRILRLAALLLAGPLATVIAGNYNDDARDVANQTITPVSAKGCDMHFLADLLNDKQDYGDRPRLIINSLNEGPELLFRTRHSVLAGPYHMNVEGNLDALRFFTAVDAAEAEAIARRRKADMVVLCDMPSQLRAYRSENPTQAIFVQQLIAGQIPDWLKPVQSPQFGDLRVFQVRTTEP